MSLSTTLAHHFRAVFFGGNWTSSNLKEQLSSVTFEDAATKVQECHTILALTFHISYYVTGVLEVFHDRPLVIRDKFSFDHPQITSEIQWQTMLSKLWTDAETLAIQIEKLPEDTLWRDFTNPQYGNYYSNITGIIEHTHYHLGQIVLLKKLVTNPQ